MGYDQVIEKVIKQFARLPGVGNKTAERFVYFYLWAPKEEALRLSEYLKDLVNNTKSCKYCYNRSSTNPCNICIDKRRNKNVICVVESPLDLISIEKTQVYNGLYFVLGGIIDPANGIGPEELRFTELTTRLLQLCAELSEIEVIFALSPTLQGEATINYAKNEIIKKISNETIKFTKLAQGLASGADLQYTDSMTLRRALNGRVNL